MARPVSSAPPPLTPVALQNFPYQAIPFPLAALRALNIFPRTAARPLPRPPAPDSRIEG